MVNSTLQPLPDMLSGKRCEIEDPHAGLVSYYVDGPVSKTTATGEAMMIPPPLLLIHSVNAAASAHEVKPLFDEYKKTRRTYAIDLPGYGHSERSERPYVQRLMVDAINAVIAEIRSETRVQAVDTLAVSLSCEFLAKAARENPKPIRSLALVSSTGFRRTTATHGPPDASCGRPGMYRIFSLPLLGQLLFRLLITPPSLRFFLRKTWGKKKIDEEMFQNSWRTCRQPGAHRAPFHFLSGYLTSADIRTVFKQLKQPVWLSHGVRGDFTDFTQTHRLASRPNWKITEFQTGALPYFEVTREFTETYDDFLSHATTDQARGS